jgi:hypothetical protein
MKSFVIIFGTPVDLDQNVEQVGVAVQELAPTRSYDARVVDVAAEVDDLSDDAGWSRCQIDREVIPARLLVYDWNPAIVEVVVLDRVLWKEAIEPIVGGPIPVHGTPPPGIVPSDVLTGGEPKAPNEERRTTP